MMMMMMMVVVVLFVYMVTQQLDTAVLRRFPCYRVFSITFHFAQAIKKWRDFPGCGIWSLPYTHYCVFS